MENRTGIMMSGDRADEMIAATREFPPSSEGSAVAIGDMRVSYAQEGESLGETPSPSTLSGKAKSALTAVTGGQPTLLMDKLGERLAFERAGARLYEALLSKHQAYGSFAGGPGEQDLLHILQEEYEHADMLQRAIKDLGGDPTAVTPSANVAANISAGLPQVLADPRTNLLQSLEAILVAELADNECWTTLAVLANQAGQDDLAARCHEAIGHEREHLHNVRAWIAAGQSREPGATGDEVEFTFTEASAVDAEGYAVSEEEAAESGEATGTRPTGKRSRSRKGRKAG
jgi:hypothetical protein